MIDTSKEAVERLARDCDLCAECLQETGSFPTGMNVFSGSSATMRALAAERDAQTARADAAEAREQALLSSYDAERKALVENAAMRHDIARLTKSLSDEVTARVAAEADVARLTAENERLRDDMKHIAKNWPESAAAKTARAAIQRKAGK